MKIGVELRIDVTKIDKARIYQGKKGKYLTMTTFINTEEVDQYDNNGFISHKKEQDEQENPPILGNCKVFWSDHQAQTGNAQQNGSMNAQGQGLIGAAPLRQNAIAGNAVGYHSSQQAPQQAQPQAPQMDNFDDDIPFS